MVLLCMMGILIVLGFFFVDQVSTMLITLPFYMPIVQKFWHRSGLVRRPLHDVHTDRPAASAFRADPVCDGAAWRLRTFRPRDIFLAAIPYLLMSMLMLIAIMLWPGIATMVGRAGSADACGSPAEVIYSLV